MSDQSNPISQESAVKTAKPWFKKKRFVIPAIVLVLIIGANVNKGKSDSNTAAPSSSSTQIDNSSNSSEPTAPSETLEPEPAPSEDVETSGQANAVQTAQDYLNSQAFSKSGLIKQLVFEQYSKADATYAANAVGADWNEQAALSAASYLESQAFSKSGLIDQLVFEGFSKSQAAYGAEQALGAGGSGGSETSNGESLAQSNARQAAESYLNSQAFSRQGLIDQLVYEKYSKSDAAYGVDATNTNWKNQAYKAAQEYLNSQSFSRGELIDQLVYEGFSQSQATYGVNKVGL
ncbi:MAG: hypothetical protein RL196_135 [Actinomycetota bacterium]|jgi:hypothetical protein